LRPLSQIPGGSEEIMLDLGVRQSLKTGASLKKTVDGKAKAKL
jgi:hypothetical protein